MHRKSSKECRHIGRAQPHSADGCSFGGDQDLDGSVCEQVDADALFLCAGAQEGDQPILHSHPGAENGDGVRDEGGCAPVPSKAGGADAGAD